MNREFQQRIGLREKGMGEFVKKASKLPLRTAIFAGMGLKEQIGKKGKPLSFLELDI